MKSAKLQADTVAQIYTHIGVDAVNPGLKDLALGLPELKELEKKWNFPFVSANLTDASGSPIFPKYVIKEVNGIRVGIFGLMSDASDVVDKIDAVSAGTIKVQDPLEAAAAVVADLSGKVDFTIALAYQKTTYDWRLARRVEGIDLIVGAQDSTKTKKANKAGNTYMVRAGEKGQYQGLFEVTLDGEKTVTNTLVPFNAEVGDDPEVKAMLKNYNDKIVALYGGDAQESGGESSAPVALRAAACEPCHSGPYEQWKTSDHAKAFSTLVSKSKQFDPTCLACHTTLFGKPGGFNMEQQQKDLVNVQCESCHGSAKDHLAEMTPIPTAKPPMATCVRCHTADRCPDFEKEYDKYWNKIAH